MQTRYVILEHRIPDGGVHFDCLFEIDDVLASWKMPVPPTHAKPVHATKQADHRKAYLDYEGPLTGARGTVTVWDAGTFQLAEGDTLSHMMETGIVICQCHGKKLDGRLSLMYLAGTLWVCKFVRPRR